LLRDRWGADTGSPSLYSPERDSASATQPYTRASNGLDQFFSSIQDQTNLSILDFAGASQANVSFITTLGHRIFSNDILHTLDEAFGGEGDFVANQADPRRADYFLRESLDFSERSFDGALVWDTLQFLAPPLLQEAVDRLFHVLRPQSALLAFFHAEEKANLVPLYNYRILESKTLSLTPRGQRKPAQYFNNRSLEKLFQKFHSVKFFLTRDHLREVIVRR
jgi:hypothetical protein